MSVEGEKPKGKPLTPNQKAAYLLIGITVGVPLGCIGGIAATNIIQASSASNTYIGEGFTMTWNDGSNRVVLYDTRQIPENENNGLAPDEELFFLNEVVRDVLQDQAGCVVDEYMDRVVYIANPGDCLKNLPGR